MRLPSKLGLFWDRITLSRLTTFFFLFAVIHCVIQVTFQIQAFTINASAVDLLAQVIGKAGEDRVGFSVLGKDDLRFCSNVPSKLSAESCIVVWDGLRTKHNNSWTSGSRASGNLASPSLDATGYQAYLTSTIPLPSASPPATTTAQPLKTVTKFVLNTAKPTLTASTNQRPPQVISGSNSRPIKAGDDDGGSGKFGKRAERAAEVQVAEINGQEVVQISGIGPDNVTAVLDVSCIRVLRYPVERLRNTKREDIVFIAFQFWVLGMSVVALLNESIPHLFASLLTHVMATGWAALAIWRTATFQGEFKKLTVDGACAPVNLLRDYWVSRNKAEVASLALDAVALAISVFFTWKLVKAFGWQTFKRIGASLTIRRIYRNVLMLSITIQLSVFFIGAAVAVWIDQLWNGAIGPLATMATLYKGTAFVTLILLWPWLASGWFAVRRELKVPMMAFLALAIVYIGCWAFMFISETFRWTYFEWFFFAMLSTASIVLTLLSFILGIVCRVSFGQGLPRYLNAHQTLDDESYRPGSPEDVEKVDFPSNDHPIPSFSDAYPAALPFSNTGHPHQPLFSQNLSSVTEPIPAHVRQPSNESAKLSRHDTRGSERSFGSDDSTHTTDGHGSRSRSKRWVIE